MKKLIPCLLLLFAVIAKAQNFEGTIRWSMKMEITDPAIKAKMEEARKQMSDPAMQAKMKEMQAKMNDPQMKAMMDANPQMKAQMENAMKAMQSGDLNSMMPKGFTLKLKGQNTLTRMEGGPMALELLYLKDKDQSYHLDRQAKTYSPVNTNRAGQGPQSNPDNKPKVTRTSETRTILNFNCTKYLVEIKEANRTINEIIWATTEIKDIDFASLSRQRVGRGQSIFFEGMEGVPLRVEVAMSEGTTTMEVTEIKKETLSAADFVIPADFKETQGMFGKF